MRLYRPIEDQLLPITRVFAFIGDLGVFCVLMACATLPVLVQLTRQRAWALIATPVTCAVLAFAFVQLKSDALTEPTEALSQYYEALVMQNDNAIQQAAEQQGGEYK